MRWYVDDQKVSEVSVDGMLTCRLKGGENDEISANSDAESVNPIWPEWALAGSSAPIALKLRTSPGSTYAARLATISVASIDQRCLSAVISCPQ